MRAISRHYPRDHPAIVPTARSAIAETPDAASTAAEDGTVLVDLEGRICFCSPGVGEMFGCNPEERIGGPVTALIPGLPLRMGTAGYNLAYARYWFPNSEWLRFEAVDTSRRFFSVDLSIRALPLPEMRGLTLVLRRPRACTAAGERDVSQHAAKFGEVAPPIRGDDCISDGTTRDGLTRLPGRELFLDRLHQALARASRDGGRVALLRIDLDHYPSVKRLHGERVADKLVQAVAFRLAQSVRDTDTVARTGGGEFAVVLGEVMDYEGVLCAVGRIDSALQGDATCDGVCVPMTVKMGMAIFPDDGRDETALLKAIDDGTSRTAAPNSRPCTSTRRKSTRGVDGALGQSRRYTAGN